MTTLEKQLSVRFETADLREIERLAKAERRTKGEIVRQLVSDALARKKK